MCCFRIWLYCKIFDAVKFNQNEEIEKLSRWFVYQFIMQLILKIIREGIETGNYAGILFVTFLFALGLGLMLWYLR